MASSSIGRLQAALAAVTNEVTVAAANLNFDFCLVKYEAPKEYQQLGSLLSAKRRQDAEDGKSHITARRLAALFQGACPPTPNLLRAYGERVSEISKLATDSISKEYAESIFGAYTGCDATSIWAAATSSKDVSSSAIQVHLLGCVLSSMWKPPEAISIWVELIEKRRNEIADEFNSGGSIHLSSLAAASQQEISRAQIAEWDSSARSWIQTADAIMYNKHTQLKLILRNINLQMSGHTVNVYESVMSVWQASLRIAENLVSGIPQEVQDGSALASLAAWHLYPDLHVFGSKIVDIKMQDPLVSAGGVLSLGCSPSATTPTDGITWSLSLAHLQYYGSPVHKQANLQADPSKLSVSEFRQVILGCVLAWWDVKEEVQMEELQNLYILSTRLTMHAGNLWPSKYLARFRFLSQATLDFRRDVEMGLKLIALGRKRRDFLPGYSKKDNIEVRSEPFFGLLKLSTFVAQFNHVEDKVTYLRRLGARHPQLESQSPLIKYAMYHPNRGKTRASFATVFEEPNALDDSSNGANTRRHTRWLKGPNAPFEVSRKEQILCGKKAAIFQNIGLTSFSMVQPSGDMTQYSLLCGEASDAAIFLPESSLSNTNIYSVKHLVTVDDWLWAIEHSLLKTGSFVFRDDKLGQTISMLEWAMSAFDRLPGRLIRTQTLRMDLINAKFTAGFGNSYWNSTDMEALLSIPKPNTAEMFSIVAFFAAGGDISPVDIPAKIMGISIDDSIYVPDKLLKDPIKSLGYVNPVYLIRILGNIGRPGFVLFSSVSHPMISAIDDGAWIKSSTVFDGKAENLLSSTSLHLSFTNWNRSLYITEDQGNQDEQFTSMEAVISIRESGKWIGDVDIMTALRSTALYQTSTHPECVHEAGAPPERRMTAIECWDEIRDIPSGVAVVKSHGNWLGRLAVASFLAQCSKDGSLTIDRVTLCPESVCWPCINAEDTFTNNVYIY